MSTESMLRKVAEQLGISRNVDIAAATGLAPSQVSKIMAGKEQFGMRVISLATIEENTGISIGQLAEWWAHTEVAHETFAQRAVENRPAFERLWTQKLGT